MHSFLLAYLTYWKPLSFLIVALGMVFEGDIVLFAAAFLYSQSFFNTIQIVVVVAGGLLIGEVFWYRLGKIVRYSRFAFVERWIEHLTARFDQHLREKTTRTLFISKFMYGLGHIMVMRAGSLSLPEKRFFRKDLVATAAWAIVVGSLGYFSGQWFFAYLRHYLRFTEVALLLALLLLIIVESVFRSLSDRL